MTADAVADSGDEDPREIASRWQQELDASPGRQLTREEALVLLQGLSPEAEALLEKHPDASPASADGVGVYWRMAGVHGYASVSGWLRAGCSAREHELAGALREQGISPEVGGSVVVDPETKKPALLLDLVRRLGSFHQLRKLLDDLGLVRTPLPRSERRWD